MTSQTSTSEPPDPATAKDATAKDAPSGVVAEITRRPARWLIFAAVLIADVMDLVDSTITNVGGPTIERDLGGGQPLLQWIGSAYTLAFAVFLITGARLGDLFGRRRLFIIGATGFTAASALCAVAWSPESLIAMRVLQASLGALMIPQGFGVLKEVFEEDEMPKVFGVFGPVMGLSAVIGPILGAAIIDADILSTDWRAIFLVNVPLGVFAVYAAIRWMPHTVASPGGGIDFGGMVLVGLSAFALIYPLIEGREQDWPAWTFAMMVGGVVLFGLFVAYERRRPADSVLIEFSLLKNANFSNGMLVATSFFAAVSGVMLVLALFWQVGQHKTPSESAIALAPLSIGMVVGMIGSFALVEKLGRKLIQTGAATTALGLVLVAVLVHGKQDPSAWVLVPGGLVIGMGMGQVFGQLFDVVLAGVEDREVGSATGVLNALQQLSFSLGVAAVGTLFFDLLDVPHLPADALTTTVLVCLVPCALTFLLAFRLPPAARAEGAH